MNLFCLADDLCHLDETQPLTVMQGQGESQQCQFHRDSTHPPSTPVDMNPTTYLIWMCSCCTMAIVGIGSCRISHAVVLI